jgi:hypothetical protein
MLLFRTMLHSKTPARVASRKFAITIVFILKDKSLAHQRTRSLKLPPASI